MQDHEMRGLLGPAYDDTTEEQRAAIEQASEMVARRWSDQDDDDTRIDALSAAMEIILGDATDVEIAARWHRAVAAELTARARLTGAIIAGRVLDPTLSEVAQEARLQVSRPSIRKALGK